MTEKPLNKRQLRSRKSRKKVIDAAIGVINEEGATNATTRRIAERAGVTWGVLQRQFGSKQAILAAVRSGPRKPRHSSRSAPSW